FILRSNLKRNARRRFPLPASVDAVICSGTLRITLAVISETEHQLAAAICVHRDVPLPTMRINDLRTTATLPIVDRFRIVSQHVVHLVIIQELQKTILKRSLPDHVDTEIIRTQNSNINASESK